MRDLLRMENSFILSLVDILYEMDKIGWVMKKCDNLIILRSSFFFCEVWGWGGVIG